jgi:hypothetical protein
MTDRAFPTPSDLRAACASAESATEAFALAFGAMCYINISRAYRQTDEAYAGDVIAFIQAYAEMVGHQGEVELLFACNRDDKPLAGPASIVAAITEAAGSGLSVRLKNGVPTTYNRLPGDTSYAFRLIGGSVFFGGLLVYGPAAA